MSDSNCSKQSQLSVPSSGEDVNQGFFIEPLEFRLLLSTDQGDFNFDGQTNLLDLDILVNHWNLPAAPWEGDANRDGYAGLDDLAIFSNYFTLLTATTAPGGIMLSSSSAPATNLPGYTTHTITLTANVGQITSVGLEFTASEINQIQPYGYETIWTDMNFLFDMIAVPFDNDSQFHFAPNSVEEIVISAYGIHQPHESATSLGAHFSLLNWSFASRDVAHIVLPDGQLADYDLTVVIDHNTLVHLQGQVGQQTGSIQGTKWHDANEDGIRNPGEPGLEDWTIFLDLDGDGMMGIDDPRTLTNAQGFYQFDNLMPGQYAVTEIMQAGWVQSYPGGVTPASHPVTVLANTLVTGVNFGNVAPPSQIAGEIDWYCLCTCAGSPVPIECGAFPMGPEDIDNDGCYDDFLLLYLDLNDNGQYDLNEPKEKPEEPQPRPQGGVRWVYAFKNVEPGTYTVGYQLPNNLAPHFSNSQDHQTVTVGPGETLNGIDFVSEYICQVTDPNVDFNSDCFVGLMDLDILGNHWGLPGTQQDGDANGDAMVGLDDLSQFLMHPFQVPFWNTASGDVVLTTTAAPTIGLPGYDTHTITLDVGASQVTSLGLIFNASAINQVNPMGLDTSFMDFNAFFPATGDEVDQDSQFLFMEDTELLYAASDDPAGIHESPTMLRAHFTGFAPFSSRDVAQIVLPAGVDASYDLTVILDNNTEIHLTGVIYTMSAPVPPGDNRSVSTGGGSTVPGGIDATFEYHNGGTFQSYLQVTPIDDITPEQLASYTFQIPTDPLVTWEIDSPGGFTGDAELTFCYLSDKKPIEGYPFEDIWPNMVDLNGDSVIDDADELMLAIYHYDGGQWVEVPGTVDPVNNTITVTVEHFSSFALGITGSRLPEPNGDFDGDNQVGLLDLDILGQNWGTLIGATKSTGDADGDGAVGLLDLDILGQTWGMSAMKTLPLMSNQIGLKIYFHQLELDEEEIVSLF